MPQLVPLNPENPQHITWLVETWNQACGPALAISARFAAFNLRPVTGGVQAGRFAVEDGQPVGVILASAHPEAPPAMSRSQGWIDAIAVVGSHQRRGIGGNLLAWAETWLADQGARFVTPGGSLRPFAPGLPLDTGAVPFFHAAGYADQRAPKVWDVARDLSDYTPPSSLRETPSQARPAQPGQEEELLGFLRREFPGRWTFEAEEFLRDGGRISDYMLLWTDQGVDGACRLTFEDSVWPMERYYPYDLPRPWGQLGSIGVSQARRGQGLGLALLDAGLRRLHNCGVRGCVIDWTTIVDFYALAGFQIYREWATLVKEL